MVRTPGNRSSERCFLEVLKLLPMATDDFFRARLETMIDLRHSLAALTTRMPWAEIEAAMCSAASVVRYLPGLSVFGVTGMPAANSSAARAVTKTQIRCGAGARQRLHRRCPAPSMHRPKVQERRGQERRSQRSVRASIHCRR